VRLIAPDRRYAASYRELIKEIVDAREPFIPFTLGFAHDDIDQLLATLDDHAHGRRLPEGFVPHSTFWLVSAAEIVGVSNLRHELTPALRIEGGHIGYSVRPSSRKQGFGVELLRLTLQEARALGLQQVLVTCGKGNLASAKVIVANGGMLHSEEFVPKRNEVVQRYWIDLSRGEANATRR
jgi:predicted acetyltransferase